MRARWIAAVGPLFLALLAAPIPTQADEAQINDRRAHVDYMLNCQGCHLPEGEGAGDVPRMKNFVGSFLKVSGGREFIVQVPGSANAPLDNARLADLLNWMLLKISPNELPDDFRPYTPEEVGKYRAITLRDVLKTRAELIGKIALQRSKTNLHSPQPDG